MDRLELSDTLFRLIMQSALNTVLHAAEWLEEISQETELAARRGVQNESVEVQA